MNILTDLRDGVISQSKASDVYAIGQLIYYVYKKAHLVKDVKVIAKLCSAYNDYERPTCSDVEGMLSNIN